MAPTDKEAIELALYVWLVVLVLGVVTISAPILLPILVLVSIVIAVGVTVVVLGYIFLVPDEEKK